MSKEKRLGRGLAALLGTPLDAPTEAPIETPPDAPLEAEPQEKALETDGPADSGPTTIPLPPQPEPRSEQTDDAVEPVAPEPAAPSGESDLMHLNVYEIDDNPFQPRRDFSEPEIASLSESLKEHDMLQPVLVRRVGSRFQLISGERRLRAAIQAGWNKVPARIREADDRLVAELAIVENLQRKDLNPVEKAMSFKRYLDEHRSTQEELAKRLKIDRSTIANLMRLLELPDEVLDALRTSVVSAGHAHALLPLGEEHLQIDYCRRVQREGWSVRETERQVTERIREEDGEESSANTRRTRTKNQQVASLEQELRMALGAKVDIRQSTRRRGQIVIHFTSHEEFDRLRNHLTDTGRLDQNAG